MAKQGHRFGTYLRGKTRKGEMNRTESQFLETVIGPQVVTGEVVQWWYEALTFKLTEKTPEGKPGIRYTPDFALQLHGGELVCYEVKGTGFAMNESLNRVKMAAQKFPIRFYVATKQTKKAGGGFRIEEY